MPPGIDNLFWRQLELTHLLRASTHNRKSRVVQSSAKCTLRHKKLLSSCWPAAPGTWNCSLWSGGQALLVLLYLCIPCNKTKTAIVISMLYIWSLFHLIFFFFKSWIFLSVMICSRTLKIFLCHDVCYIRILCLQLTLFQGRVNAKYHIFTPYVCTLKLTLPQDYVNANTENYSICCGCLTTFAV